MPIPAGVVRVVLSGALPESEIWSTGFFLQGINDTSPAGLTTLAQNVANVLMDQNNGGGMADTLFRLMNTQTTWIKTTCYAYSGGSDKSSSVGEYAWPTALTGGTSNGVPSQIACVISLRTAHPGRSFRGRLYLPATGPNLQESGQLLTTAVDELAAAWANTFHALNAGLVTQSVVVSTKLSLATPITGVVVDSKLDTMRSRAKSSTIEHTKVSPVAA